LIEGEGEEAVISDLVDGILKLIGFGVYLRRAQSANINDVFDDGGFPLLAVALGVHLPLKLHKVAGEVLVDPDLAGHLGVIADHLLGDHEVPEFL
jgi:hypothetical protein